MTIDRWFKKQLCKWLVRPCARKKSNQFRWIVNGRSYPILFKRPSQTVKVKGRNNTVEFVGDAPSRTFPSGLGITIAGNGNRIRIERPWFAATLVGLVGDGNELELGRSNDCIRNARFVVADGGRVKIGTNVQFGGVGGGRFRCVVNNCAERKCRLVIGDDTYMSHDVLIRTSDGHAIVDADGRPLNEPKDVLIGRNCWIGARAVLLKGTVLPDNTIVGAASLVTKAFDEPNLLVGGHPAKILRHGVNWDKRSYATCKRAYEHAHNQ